MLRRDGYPIVLTADRTLMADYCVLLDGMTAASQTTRTPAAIMNHLLMPRAAHPEGQSLVAPLGLRRVEAALVRGGIDPSDIIVVDDAHLHQAIGPATLVVGISSGEPHGLGMSSSTMAGVAGGDIYPLAMFRQLLGQVRAYLQARAPQAQVLLGGPGAWQLAQDTSSPSSVTLAQTGVDHVVVGYSEGNVAEVFSKLLAQESLPAVTLGEGVSVDQIPPIRGATTMGVVEISRGCGLGCGFCSIATTPMGHLPTDTILADVETNLAAGKTALAALSEDFFRYGASGVHCNPATALALLEQIRAFESVRLLQLDHANVASIAQWTDGEIRQARDLLVGDQATRHPWVNVGVETAAGELLQANGGRAKMGAIGPDTWGEMCEEQLRRLCRAGFLPMVSLLVGLPGETPEHVQQTLDWVRRFRGEAITIFPVIYAPLDGTAPPVLTRLHWDLVRECYRFNFKWTPRIYLDDQTGAGAPLSRRLLIQLLAKGQVLLWTGHLARHRRRAPA